MICPREKSTEFLLKLSEKFNNKIMKENIEIEIRTKTLQGQLDELHDRFDEFIFQIKNASKTNIIQRIINKIKTKWHQSTK